MPLRAVCANDFSVFPPSAVMQTDFGSGVLSAEQTLLGQCQLWEAQGTGLALVGKTVGAGTPSYRSMVRLETHCLLRLTHGLCLEEAEIHP